jgi:hypothetical protein
MATNYIPLDKINHKDIKIKTKHQYEHTANSHLAAATLVEYAQLAHCMPIVYIKDPDSDKFFSVAVLGLEQGKNMYLHDGKWMGQAIPLNMVRYPFDIRQDQENRLGIMIDENSELVGDEGEALFDKDGEPTEYLNNRQKLLGDLARSDVATQQFVKQLEELELLEPMNMVIYYHDGSTRNMTGIYVISEKRLNELDDEKILALHKSKFLGAIYTSMLSLGQIQKLIELSGKTDKPIRHIQLASAEVEEPQK